MKVGLEIEPDIQSREPLGATALTKIVLKIGD
jgi:hypothetical protein